MGREQLSNEKAENIQIYLRPSFLATRGFGQPIVNHSITEEIIFDNFIFFILKIKWLVSTNLSTLLCVYPVFHKLLFTIKQVRNITRHKALVIMRDVDYLEYTLIYWLIFGGMTGSRAEYLKKLIQK